MRSSRIRSSVLILAATVLVGWITGCANRSPARAWCPAVPGHRVECGIVTRPLVANRPDLGTTDVGYAVVRHGRPGAAAGTIVPNPGGPGVPVIANSDDAVQRVAGLLDEYDLVLIDPRGTGVSDAVNCGVSTVDYNLGSREEQREMVGTCADKLGPRAAGYTSAATADDFDAIRARLGVDKLVLYGSSYGTYLMPVFARRHPDRVRSIVLAGAYPLDFDLLQRPNAEAVSLALQRICDRSHACDGNTAVADLHAVATRLRTRPIPVAHPRPVLLTEGELANLVFETATSDVSADPNALVPLGTLPAALHESVRGDDGPLRAFAETGLSEPDDENIDLYIAVVCNDYPTLWQPNATVPQREQQYARAVAGIDLGPFSAEGFDAGQRDGGDACIRWPAATHVQATGDALPDVPVLALTGDLDAVTPEANGRLAAARFPHATFVTVPNTGHTPGVEPTGCVTGIVARFIRTGNPEPTSCVADLPPIKVTPVTN
ncbi:alpha/beta fold hydrolase [Nocardia terpenica]|uniref:Alpha/beta hydrolase n=1 Tax=Nocardia terpenica TaxID=455432 RepID=A0A164IJV5_9NOCA|nr:alpha/beta hydrolase [Nocardia terpenica]KZM69517.1 alpha/beta hydrolase [Nocardia terpenica]NQE89193.1 alpha/beta fold hydrolase [Nocardia terpenica]